MREKSTGYVVMGILAVGGDLSGYEIRQWIEQAVGFFWRESFGQIYPELKRLSAAKLVKALPDEGARGTKRYRITAAGRAELQRWLRRPPTAERVRSELLLKLFFGPVTGAETARAFLAEAAAAHEERVAAIQAAEDMVVAQDRAADTLVYSLITILSGQLVYAARLEWARAALAMLEAHRNGGNEAVLRTYQKAKRRHTKGKAP